ncbi:isochorismatase family protein [Microvirga massiliensis]|uniref:isochorismatase family protein n=1 Tax=Microvirga massiliensis TaxID=1033741 RepID=UPI00062BDB89|nr:isochorismatase family protein [Microvirga massiliensis]
MAKDSANAQSGFYGTFPPGRSPVLLVVDFQCGFTDTDVSPLASDCGAVIRATNRLISAMRGAGPVIFTVVGYEPNMADSGIWPQKCASLKTLIRGTKAVELDPRLEYDPSFDAILNKQQASAFFGTPLAGILAANRCDMLVIAGCTTSGCVRASAVDAVQYGFPPFVVRDCVADRSPAQHESNLIDLESKYAEVLDLENTLEILTSIKAGRAQATKG